MPEIPDIFYQHDNGEPFNKCISCGKPLYINDEEYFIEKAFRNFPSINAREVVFEYAICFSCTTKMRSSLSLNSRARVDEFFIKKLSQKDFEKDFSDPLEFCLLSNRHKNEEQEYQIYAHCKGNEINGSQGFFMISGTILDEINELLSPETKDELDRFWDNNFGLPPELKELFKTHRPIFT